MIDRDTNSKRLTLQVEQIEAERIQNLSELASLRRTTPVELMESLGLRPAGYG